MFSTTDLSLAAALYMTFPIASLDRSDPRRVKFVFEDSDELKKACETFFAGASLVEPKAYFSALRNIKNRLYGTIPFHK